MQMIKDCQDQTMRNSIRIGEDLDVKCPYCGLKARRITGAELYPHRKKLAKKKFLRCDQCDAHVGCHEFPKHKWRPLGVMANKKLRQKRMLAHSLFDPIWQSGELTRTEAYSWLAERMGISTKETHIGMFNEDQCDLVVELCRTREAI